MLHACDRVRLLSLRDTDNRPDGRRPQPELQELSLLNHDQILQVRYFVWNIKDGPPHTGTSTECELGLSLSLSLLDELNARPPLSLTSEGFDGDRAWATFLDLPRAIHVYFESEADRIRFEYSDGVNGIVAGTTSFAACKEAIALFFDGTSLGGFLSSRAYEIYDPDD